MTEHHKYIIIGAGPGGLQMGYFLGRKDRDYLILEKSQEAGSSFKKYPVHRKMISLNKKYNYFEEDDFNWRHDWNSLLSDDEDLKFTHYTDELFPYADDYYRYLGDYAKKLALQIRYKTEVTRIARPEGDLFKVSTATGEEFTCEVLLLALGPADPQTPDEIEGIELCTPYKDQSIDLDIYKNKRVGILGQGNSAFETANHIAGAAAIVNILAKGPIKFAWETHYVGDLRAINNNVFDMYQLKSLNAVLNPRVKKIERTESGTLVTTHEYDYPTSPVPGTLRLTREYDIVINCTGWRFVPERLFAPEVTPDSWYNGKYPALTPRWESANVQNLYFIGGAMVGNDKKSASGFIHGYRYNIRVLSNLLEEQYEGVPFPTNVMDTFEWDTIADHVYQRSSISAALFQLYGTLCDVIVVDEERRVTVLQELPLAHVPEMDFGDSHVFTLSLEFGFHHYTESAINFLGPSDPNRPDCAAFLHPVIRYRHRGQRDEFHFGDSLLVRWDRPHGTGGAVMSYHLDFQQWLCGKVGVPVAVGNGHAGNGNGNGDVAGPFRPWTPEEYEAWAERTNRVAEASTCHNSLRTESAPRAT